MTDRERFAAALAATFHPQMEPGAVDYLIDHFRKALIAVDADAAMLLAPYLLPEKKTT